MSSFVLWMSAAMAHDPGTVSYLVARHEGAWMLRVSVPAVSLERALSTRLGAAPAGLDLATYEAEAVRAVREGVSLVVDGHPVRLGEATVHLGPHQSDLQFALPDAPATVGDLTGTRVWSMSEAGVWRNLLRLVDGRGLVQWVLTAGNDFAAEPEAGRLVR